MSELKTEAEPAEVGLDPDRLLPSSAYPIRPQLRQLVYQALTS